MVSTFPSANIAVHVWRNAARVIRSACRDPKPEGSDAIAHITYFLLRCSSEELDLKTGTNC